MEHFLFEGVWPQTRLHAVGYEVDLRCKLCKSARDIVDHRLFECPAAEDVRRSLRWEPGGGSLAEARKDPLAKRGLALDPTVGQPNPASEGSQKFRYTEAGYDEAMDDAHYVFIDGGCTQEWHPRLNRATWSVVVADSTGLHTAACSGPVWDSLPQTSQAGEIVGLAAARQVVSGRPKKLVSDCMNVVKEVKAAVAKNHRRVSFYSGVLRDSSLEKGNACITDAIHVKSHQADCGFMPENISQQEEICISGNKAADELATEARVQHPAFKPDPLKVARRSFLMAKNVLLLAAKALPLWQAGKKGGRKEYREEVLQQRSIRQHQRQLAQAAAQKEKERPEKTPADGGHFWLDFGAKGSRCLWCQAKASNDEQQFRKSKEECSRDLGQLGQVIQQQASTRHDLYWSQHCKSALRVLCCRKCDAYATLSPVNLLKPCAPKIRRPNWERLQKGRFPTNKFGNLINFSPPVKVDTHAVSSAPTGAYSAGEEGGSANTESEAIPLEDISGKERPEGKAEAEDQSKGENTSQSSQTAGVAKIWEATEVEAKQK